MTRRLNSLRPIGWVWLLTAGLLLGACHDRPTAEAAQQPTARDPHTRNVELVGVRSTEEKPLDSSSLRDVMRHGRQQLAATAASGSVDQDFVALLKVHERCTAYVVKRIVSSTRHPVLRALADTLGQHQRRDAKLLTRLTKQLPARLAADEASSQYAAFQDGMRALLDSVARQPLPDTANADADFVRCLVTQLHTGMLLTQEEIAHGSNRQLITFAHHLLHDQRRLVRHLSASLVSDSLVSAP
jgi:uncharacterized protein (DUF305 family)